MKKPNHPFGKLCLLIAATCAVMPAALAQDDTNPPAVDIDEKKSGTMIRMICVESLSKKDEKFILATKTDEGEWKHHGTIDLRAPLVTDWVRLPNGTLHLLRGKEGEAKSVGSFIIPEKLERALVILIAKGDKKSFQSHLINPAGLKYSKGKTLIVNYSKTPALVSLGGIEKTVPPGQRIVVDAKKNENNMYRALVGYRDAEKQLVISYDRFISSNPETRKLMFIFADADTGLKVMNMSESGPFE